MLAPAQFQPVQTYRAGVGPGWGGTIAIAVADVNGDGKPDVLVGGTLVGGAGIGVLLGNGDGTFQPAQTYSTGSGQVICSIAVTDVNGDGKPDLIVAQGSVAVLFGNGDGSFQSAQNYPTGSANWVAVADLNGDHIPDLAVTQARFSTSFEGGAGVLLGNGDGTFGAMHTYYSGGYYPTSIAVADVNGDGTPDLVVDNSSSISVFNHGSVGILLGNGDGTFRYGFAYEMGGFNGGSIAVADVNGDGRPDVVAANNCANNNCDFSTVSVLLNNGDGGFQKPKVFSITGGWGANAVAVADVNGNGFPDLLVAHYCDNRDTCDTGSVGLLLGKGNGYFTLGASYSSGGYVGIAIAIADVNGDGVPDVVVANECDLNNCSNAVVGVLLSYPGASKTVVTTSGSPTFVGQAVTFNAKVTSSFREIPDGELVAFYDGTAPITSVPLAGGTATYTTSSLAARTHTIKAEYSGDTASSPSKGRVQQVVRKYPTTTTLSSSLNSSNYGQPVTLTARVTSAGPAPTGWVIFKSGSMTLGSKTLNASGVATLTTAKIPVGANTLTSTYIGDASNGKSVSAAIPQTASQTLIRMVLTSTPNPSTFGKLFRFTVTLTSNGGLPSGQLVNFSYNNATLGAAYVNHNGVVTFYNITLPRGSDVVTATYPGTVDYSSASATVTQVVN
jgi:hypothetical protein